MFIFYFSILLSIFFCISSFDFKIFLLSSASQPVSFFFFLTSHQFLLLHYLSFFLSFFYQFFSSLFYPLSFFLSFFLSPTFFFIILTAFFPFCLYSSLYYFVSCFNPANTFALTLFLSHSFSLLLSNWSICFISWFFFFLDCPYSFLNSFLFFVINFSIFFLSIHLSHLSFFFVFFFLSFFLSFFLTLPFLYAWIFI